MLVHLASGVGNIVLATPLLVELDRQGWRVDVWLSADYEQTADLFTGWCVVEQVLTHALRPRELGHYDLVIPAVPPFYWSRYESFHASLTRTATRPPDALFYKNEQAYYLSFVPGGRGARRTPAVYRLPISAVDHHPVSVRTLTLAPGCKTGEMAAKRWPYFSELARRFEDVVVVGTPDDLRSGGVEALRFPDHVRVLAGKLSLRETAEVLAGSGVVLGNDSGLSHVAAAVGTPTVMIFGPTPHRTLGPLPPNVTVLRAGLYCEPCWFGERLVACERRVDCLSSISVELVEAQLVQILGASGVGVTSGK